MVEDSLIHVNLASIARFHRARYRQWLKMALQLFRMLTTLFAWQADGEKICMNLYGLILLLKPPPDKPNLLSHEMLGSVPVELILSLWRCRVDCYNKKSICRAVKEGLFTRVPLDFSMREIALVKKPVHCVCEKFTTFPKKYCYCKAFCSGSNKT